MSHDCRRRATAGSDQVLPKLFRAECRLPQSLVCRRLCPRDPRRPDAGTQGTGENILFRYRQGRVPAMQDRCLAGEMNEHWNLRPPLRGDPAHRAAQFESVHAPPFVNWQQPDWAPERVHSTLMRMWKNVAAELLPEYCDRSRVQQRRDMPGGDQRMLATAKRDIRVYVEKPRTLPDRDPPSWRRRRPGVRSCHELRGRHHSQRWRSIDPRGCLPVEPAGPHLRALGRAADAERITGRRSDSILKTKNPRRDQGLLTGPRFLAASCSSTRRARRPPVESHRS